MAILKRLFWNPQERRIAMVWRLLLHTVLMVLILIPIGLALMPFLDRAGNVHWEISQDLIFLIQVLNNVLITSSIVISIWLAGRWLDRRQFRSFGVHINRTWWIDFTFGLGLGAFLLILIFSVEWIAGWIEISGTNIPDDSGRPFTICILIALVRFVCVGIMEEFVSRGYHLKNLAEGFSAFKFISPRLAILAALVLSSAIFGLLHLGNPNASWISTFNIFLAGVFLAIGYLLTGELAIPIAVHITWNFFQGNVFGFPVSGTNAGATFIAVQETGPDLFTGGAFGPEAGLVGLTAILLGSLLTVYYVRQRYGGVSLLDQLAVPEFLPRHQVRLAMRRDAN